MKVIVISWRDPGANLQQEQFEQEKFRVHTEPGWLKLYSKEQGQVVRLIPVEHVRLVEFGEVQEKPRIIKPTEVEVPFPDALVKAGN